MSRFSAEPWQLTLDGCGWRLSRDHAELSAPVQGDSTTLAAALATLDTQAPLRGGRLAVELRDKLLRYLVIEWPAGLRGRAERQAWVSERFREVHGADAALWVFALDREGGSARQLACAAPRDVVEAVSAFAAARRLRITAFRGSFIAAVNRVRNGLDAGTGGLALQGDGQLTMGIWRDGEWRRIRSMAASDDSGAALRQTLASWLPELAVEPAAGSAPATLHAIGLAPVGLPAGWQFRLAEAGR